MALREVEESTSGAPAPAGTPAKPPGVPQAPSAPYITCSMPSSAKPFSSKLARNISRSFSACAS